MTYLYHLEYVTKHQLGYSDMVTGYNKQNYRMAETDTFTSFVTYILLTTGMNLIGQTKILTDYGRYEPV